MNGIPRVETERLVLREHRASDFDAYAALWADERVTRFIGGVPLTREQSWMRLLRYRGMWAVLGFGFWLIEEKSTGKVIGETGLQQAERDIEPSLRDTMEAGWVLVPEMQGKGMAREAVDAALGWARRNFTEKPVSCIIAEDNRASIRLARSFGFREIARTSYQGAAVIVFTL